MISVLEAREFAETWIDAWNSHNIDSILEHYRAVFGKRAAEIFFFGKDGMVNRSIAHYNEV